MIHLGHVIIGTGLAWLYNELVLKKKGGKDEKVSQAGNDRDGGNHRSVKHRSSPKPDRSGSLGSHLKTKGVLADEFVDQSESDESSRSPRNHPSGKQDNASAVRETERLTGDTEETEDEPQEPESKD